MIRHHDAQDSLSADAVSIYVVGGKSTALHSAPPPGHVEIRDAGRDHHGAASSPPLTLYPVPLSICVLLVVSAIALLALLRLYREVLVLRRVRDRYRAFVGGPSVARFEGLPAGSLIGGKGRASTPSTQLSAETAAYVRRAKAAMS